MLLVAFNSYSEFHGMHVCLIISFVVSFILLSFLTYSSNIRLAWETGMILSYDSDESTIIKLRKHYIDTALNQMIQGTFQPQNVHSSHIAGSNYNRRNANPVDSESYRKHLAKLEKAVEHSNRASKIKNTNKQDENESNKTSETNNDNDFKTDRIEMKSIEAARNAKLHKLSEISSATDETDEADESTNMTNATSAAATMATFKSTRLFATPNNNNNSADTTQTQTTTTTTNSDAAIEMAASPPDEASLNLLQNIFANTANDTNSNETAAKKVETNETESNNDEAETSEQKHRKLPSMQVTKQVPESSEINVFDEEYSASMLSDDASSIMTGAASNNLNFGGNILNAREKDSISIYDNYGNSEIELDVAESHKSSIASNLLQANNNATYNYSNTNTANAYQNYTNANKYNKLFSNVLTSNAKITSKNINNNQTTQTSETRQRNASKTNNNNDNETQHSSKVSESQVSNPSSFSNTGTVVIKAGSNKSSQQFEYISGVPLKQSKGTTVFKLTSHSPFVNAIPESPLLSASKTLRLLTDSRRPLNLTRNNSEIANELNEMELNNSIYNENYHSVVSAARKSAVPTEVIINELNSRIDPNLIRIKFWGQLKLPYTFLLSYLFGFILTKLGCLVLLWEAIVFHVKYDGVDASVSSSEMIRCMTGHLLWILIGLYIDNECARFLDGCMYFFFVFCLCFILWCVCVCVCVFGWLVCFCM